jgi:hypothetical protein
VPIVSLSTTIEIAHNSQEYWQWTYHDGSYIDTEIKSQCTICCVFSYKNERNTNILIRIYSRLLHFQYSCELCAISIVVDNETIGT